MLDGEMGRYSLSIDVKVRVISFWGEVAFAQCTKLTVTYLFDLIHLIRGGGDCSFFISPHVYFLYFRGQISSPGVCFFGLLLIDARESSSLKHDVSH